MKDKGNPDPTLIAKLLIEKIKKNRFRKHIKITSENHIIDPYLERQIRRAKIKKVTVGYLHYRYGNPFARMRKVNYHSIHPNFWLTSKKLVKKAHEKGLLIFPWAPKKKKLMKKLISWGVDGIITNYPDKLQEIINALNKSSTKKS